MPPIQEIQEIEAFLDQIVSILEMSIQSGEVIPDEVLGELAQIFNEATQRINELESEQVPATPEGEPQLQQSMPSSNVESFGYDDKNQRLLVRFLGDYPNRNGPVYAYDGVPKVIFDVFRNGSIPARTDGKNKWGSWWKGKVPSLGASLYTLIKAQNYPYQRIS